MSWNSNIINSNKNRGADLKACLSVEVEIVVARLDRQRKLLYELCVPNHLDGVTAGQVDHVASDTWKIASRIQA